MCQESNNTEILKMLFYGYVCSKPEYARIIWYLIYETYRIAIQSIQSKNFKYLSYKSFGGSSHFHVNMEIC